MFRDMTEPRTRWTDDRLTDRFQVIENEFHRLNRILNGLPGEVIQMKAELHGVKEDTETCRKGIERLNASFQASRTGLSRGEKIALLGAGGGFLGAVVAALALLAGAGA